MPKVVQYTKGSIIYFEKDMEERIYILQNGAVLLSSIDIESKQPVSEQVRNGEFFGVKSALGHFPREETATALVSTTCVILSVQEFENLISSNKPLIMKMLKVFSNQLRQIHKKIESILNNVVEDQQTGMLAVAKSFFDDEKYGSACDVYEKYFARFPKAINNAEVSKCYNECKLRKEKIEMMSDDSFEDVIEGDQKDLKIFGLPAFEIFAKLYKPGQVIIAEYEPGDSFYLIQSGEVQLLKCVNGSQKNLDILKPGEFFGEMAILDNSPRSATCMAIGNVKCLEFNKENFELLITGNPQMALLLLKLFCKRIYDQKRRLNILTIKDYQARFADVFLMLNEMTTGGNFNPNDKVRRFDVTLNDVAHWAGLNIETTKQELQKMVAQRKIEIFDTYIVVNNILDIKRFYESRCNVDR